MSNTFKNIINRSSEGVDKYNKTREIYFTKLNEEEKRKQLEYEKRMYEKKRKEIERIRKIKQTKFRARLDQCEQRELENVLIRDINDNEQGIYNIGGSFGEIIIALLALDEFHKREKNEIEINYEFVLNTLKKISIE